MEHALLAQIIIVFGLSALTLLVCDRLHLPTIVGFLLVGVMAGPHGLSLISAAREVEALAEIGVVLLLFTIGIEFDLGTLARLRRVVLIGGTAQMAATLAAVAVLLFAGGATFPRAALGGMLVSLSSTAIVLKILHKRAEIDALHGRFTLGVLIFQDLVIVPMLLAIPLFAGTTTFALAATLRFLVEAITVLVLIWVAARWVLPRLLHQIARARDPELFQVSIVVLGFGIGHL
ncbi:MAG: cation:proton antiporter, partial [Candidatus Binatia bacterium]